MQSLASGALATAFGTKTTAEGLAATALGVGADASKDNSVALGSGATTTTDATYVPDVTVGGIKYTFAGGTRVLAGNQVSVGSAGYERQIKNVAPGQITLESTDAINGSQLFVTQQAIGTMGASVATTLGGGSTVNADGSISAPSYTINGNTYNNIGDVLAASTPHFYSVNSTDATAGNYNNNGATGTNALAAGANAVAAGSSSTAVGYGAQALGIRSVAQGNAAIASGTNALALGNATAASFEDAVAVGSRANASAVRALAFGSDAVASEDTTTAIGWAAQATAGQATAIGRGAKATAISALAMGGAANASAQSSIAIGYTTEASQNSSIAIGNASKATGSGAVGIGWSSNSSGTSAVAVGLGSKATANFATAVGRNANAATASAIAIGDGAQALAVGAPIAIGFSATVAANNTNGISIGTSTGTNAINGTDNTAIGRQAGRYIAGNTNYAFGNRSGNFVTGHDNYAQGIAGGQYVAGSQNVAVGYHTGQAIVGTANMSIGYQNSSNDAASGGLPATGATNTVTGGQRVFGNNNLIMGRDAGRNLGKGTLTLSSNGQLTGRTTTASSDNVILGTGANNFAAGDELTTSNNIAIGTDSISRGGNAIAQGTKATASGVSAIAIGTGAQATATNSIAIGTGNIVSGEGSGALGDPSYITGAGTYTVGNDNGTSTAPIAADNAGAFGNNNLLNADADGSRIIGNNNDVQAANVMVMGNNVSVASGLAGAVVLGNDSTVSAAVDTDSATVNGITYSGFAGNAPADGDVVSVGSTTAPRQIQNVAAGQINATSTDAINGSQLYATNNVIGNVANSTADILGGDAAVGADGKLTMTDIGGTGESTVHDAIAKVNEGFKLTSSASEGTASGTSVEQIQPGETVTVDAGKNIKITQDENKISVATADDVNFNSVTIGDAVNNTTLTGTSDGLSVGGDKITNVAAGNVSANSTDAVNGGQLYEVQELAGKGWNIQGNGGAASNVAPGATVNFVDGSGTTASVTDVNGTPTVSYSVNKSALAVGADGNVSAATAGDAFATATDVADAINASEKTSSVAAGNNTSVSSTVNGNHTAYTVNAEKSTVSAGSTAVAVTSATDAATDVTDYTVDLAQSTKDDIQKGVDAKDIVDNQGLTFTGDSGTTGAKLLGSNVAVNGDDNITISADADGVKVELNKQLDLTAAGSVTTGNTVLNNDGVSITGGPSITTGGVDAGGKPITNVASGGNVATNAANIGDVTQAVNAAKTHFYSVNSTDTAAGNYNNDGATGANALAAGVNAKASAGGDTAIGYGANANAGNAVVIGTNATVGTGTSGITSAARGIAIGLNANAQVASSIAMGQGATTTGRGSIANSIAIGNSAYTYGSNGVAIGAGAGLGSTETSGNNVTVGAASGQNNKGTNNVALGPGSGNNLGVYVNQNIAIGSGAGNNVTASTGFADYQINGGNGYGHNIGIGNGSGINVDGNVNVAMGQLAGRNVQGNANTGLGLWTGWFVEGDRNSSIGAASGGYVVGDNNTGLGHATGNNVVGDNNTALGNQVGNYITGSGNVSLGNQTNHATATAVRSLERAVAIGDTANTYGNDSIAMGSNAVAGVDGSNSSVINAIAIGNGAQATATNSISIGTGNIVSGEGSGALGDPSYITGAGTYTVGNNNGTSASPIAADNAGAFGNENAMSADADGSRIVGNSNSIESANVMVMGNNVSVAPGLDGAVVLGNDSTVSAAVDTDSATVNGITYGGFAGNAPADGDVVSIGSTTAPRQIQNVAAGQINATSTDAINGSQLYATQNTIGNLAQTTANNFGGGVTVNADGSLTQPTYTVAGNTYNDVGSALAASTTHFYSVNSTDAAAGNYNNDGATGVDALAAGVKATASGANAVAIGNTSQAASDRAIALGDRAVTGASIGSTLQNTPAATVNNNSTPGLAAIAIGQQAQALGNYTTAIGMRAGEGAKGSGNIMIGRQAGLNSETSNNIFMGASAGQSLLADPNGNAGAPYLRGYNVGLGVESLQAENTGSYGENNTAVGLRAGRWQSGSSNTHLGSFAGVGQHGNFNFNGGYFAGAYQDGDKNVNIGINAGSGNSTTDRLSASYTVNIGDHAKSQQDNAVAIGLNALTDGESAIAIGNGAQATATNSISIGTGNIVSGEGSGALGDPSYITGAGTYTIGNDNGTSTAPIAADNAGAFGNNNLMNADADDSRIIGNNNDVQAANVMVMGNNVSVASGLAGAVVLGNDSTVSAAVDTNSATVNGITYGGFAGNAPADGDVVSVGSTTAPRQIQNVAAGQINATSTDAINGSQLYATQNTIGNLAQTTADNFGGGVTVNADGSLTQPTYTVAGNTYNDVGSALAAAGSSTHFYSVNSTDSTAGNYNNDGATGSNALAAGVGAAAQGLNGVAVGSNIVAGNANNVTAIGSNTTVNGRESTAVGSYISIDGPGNNALGSNVTMLGSQSVAVGNGVVAGTASTTEVTAVGRRAQATGNQSTALGGQAKALGGNSLALAHSATATGNNSVAAGYNANAAGTSSIAMGNTANATGNNTIAMGTNSVTSGNNAVAIGSSANAVFRGVAMGMSSVAGTNSSVAIGDAARATVAAGDVAIGQNSATAAVTAVNDATVNNISYGGFAGNAPRSAFSVGSAGAERQIQNVAAGQISATSTDAINGSQLYATNNVIGNVAASTATVLGGNATVGSDGSISMSDIGGTGESTVHDAIEQVNETANKGFNLTTSASDGTVSGTTVEQVQPGETVTVDAGKNIAVTQNGNSISVATADDVRFNSVTAGNSVLNNDGLTIAGGPSITSSGIDAGGKVIGNVASGQAGTDAVNVDQLNQAINGIQIGSSVVAAGNNTRVTADTQGTVTTYTVDAEKSTVSAGSTAVAVTSATDASTDVTDYTVDLAQSTKDDIQKGVDAKDIVDNQGLTFTGDSGTTGAKLLGSSVAVNGDDNITTTADADGVKVELNKQLDLTAAGSVTMGDTVINNDGLSITGGPSVTTNGIDAGGSKITNVAAGDVSATSTDAVNGSQLYEVSETANKGFNLTTSASDGTVSGTTVEQIQPGETVTVDAGKNIAVTQNGNSISVATADDVSFNSVTIGDATDNTTLTSTSDGLDVGGSKITNVAAGDLSATSTDAVNGSQLYTTNENVAANTVKIDQNTADIAKGINFGDGATSNQYALGDTINVKGDSNVTSTTTSDGVQLALADNINVTSVTAGNTVLNNDGVTISGGNNGTVSLSNSGLDNGGNTISNVASGGDVVTNAANIGDVQTAASAAKSEVAAGSNIASVTQKTGANGQTVYTVNANGTTASAGSNAVTVAAGTPGADNVTDYAVDLSQASKDSLAKADSALQNVVTQIDGNDVKTLTQSSNNANFVTGDNIELTADNGGIKIATAKDVVFDTVSVGDTLINSNGISIANGPSITSSGINAGGSKITNVAAGEDDTDAVNMSQLNAIAANQNVAKVVAGNNTSVTSEVDGNTTTYTVNAEKSTVTGSSAITATASDQGNDVTDYALDLSDATKADIAQGVDAKDIVDNQGLTFTGDSGSTGVKKLGDTLALTGDSNITTAATAAGVQVKLNNNLNLTDAGSVTMGDTVINNDGLSINNGPSVTANGIDAGGKQITNVASGGDVDTNAANIGDVKKAVSATKVEVEAGKNIEVSSTTGSDGQTVYTVATADDLDVNSVKSGDTTLDSNGVSVGDKVALTKDGFTVGDVSVTENGLDNGGNKITNVAAGTADTDAVNVSQLKAAQAASTTKVAAGDNIEVSTGTNADGSTTYTVATAKDLNVDSVTAGDTTVSNDGVSIADGPSITKNGIDAAGNKVSNVAAGDISASSTDAVNGSQLYATNTQVAANTEALNKGLGFTADSGNTVNRKLGETVAIAGDSNIKTATTSDGVQVTLNKDLTVDSVKAGNTTVNNDGVKVGDSVALTESGLNNGGNTITNVGEGVNGTDAVNVNQLNRLAGNINNINNRIEGVENNANAGTAAAMAVAGLPQAYLPGKSMVAIAGGVYRGESGYALGFSSISDGGNWVIKGTASGNSRGHYGATAGVGYQW
ncbi:MAG: hypothetical protein Q4G28_01520 [Neisseria sp.]|nr:hypothetical protein [Neisseria sp.]